LFPDTLYFWFDLAVKLWDTFIIEEATVDEFQLIFKPEFAATTASKKYPSPLEPTDKSKSCPAYSGLVGASKLG